MDGLITYAMHGGVAQITMNDGKANVMSAAMLRTLHDAFDRAEADRAIVLLRSGRPGVFSAGFDLNVFAARDPQRTFEMVRAGADLALRLLRYPYPMVARIEGHAYPMGAFITLCCDVRLAAQGGFRIGLNEVAIGISPPSFAIELARSRLHPAWLARTVTTGAMFEPADALTAGFYDQLVEASKMDETADAVIGALNAIDRAAHAKAKARLRARLIAALERAIEDEINLSTYLAQARSAA